MTRFLRLFFGFPVFISVRTSISSTVLFPHLDCWYSYTPPYIRRASLFSSSIIPWLFLQHQLWRTPGALHLFLQFLETAGFQIENNKSSSCALGEMVRESCCCSSYNIVVFAIELHFNRLCHKTSLYFTRRFSFCSSKFQMAGCQVGFDTHLLIKQKPLWFSLGLLAPGGQQNNDSSFWYNNLPRSFSFSLVSPKGSGRQVHAMGSGFCAHRLSVLWQPHSFHWTFMHFGFL